MHAGNARSPAASFQRLPRTAHNLLGETRLALCEIPCAAVPDLAGRIHGYRFWRDGNIFCFHDWLYRTHAAWPNEPTAAGIRISLSVDLDFLDGRLARESDPRHRLRNQSEPR